MNLAVRIVKIILTFGVFIISQAFLTASINTFFYLIPVKFDSFFGSKETEVATVSSSVSSSNIAASSAVAGDAYYI